MYEKHFGLRCRPFRSTPASDCYYPATTHELALERLCGALEQDDGPLLLVGAPGTGKTLLCHRLLERLGSRVSSAFLTHGHVSGRTGLLQMIHYELALPYDGHSEQELRLALTEFLLQNFKAGRGTVLLVDEAQLLTPDLLEELRLLGNLEARHGKALQVILIAQPAILETLAQPELASLRQRLAVRAVLEPLATDEAADFLLHQLRLAGGRPEDLITSEALDVLARGALGIPRLLNQAAHQAFLLAFQAGTTPVDVEAALEALSVLRLPFDADAPEATKLQEGSGRAQDDEGQGDSDDGDRISVHAINVPDAGRHFFVPPRRPAG